MTGLDVQDNKYRPIGKFQIVGKLISESIILRLIVYGSVDVRGLPNNSSCYIRLTHTPYTLNSGKTLKSDVMKWKQSFFL